MGNVDECFVLDNEALCSVTICFFFSPQLNGDLKNIAMYLIRCPRLHFFLMGLPPLL